MFSEYIGLDRLVEGEFAIARPVGDGIDYGGDSGAIRIEFGLPGWINSDDARNDPLGSVVSLASHIGERAMHRKVRDRANQRHLRLPPHFGFILNGAERFEEISRREWFDDDECAVIAQDAPGFGDRQVHLSDGNMM